MFTKEEFINDYSRELLENFGKNVDECSSEEKYQALVQILTNCIGDVRRETSLRHINESPKKVYYFSMEFLIGPLLENYLMNMGIKDTVEKGLKELNIDPQELYGLDKDPGLGNGGLGRLAACFLDSIAALGIAGVGMGLRYRFGLFKQKLKAVIRLSYPTAGSTADIPGSMRFPAMLLRCVMAEQSTDISITADSALSMLITTACLRFPTTFLLLATDLRM